MKVYVNKIHYPVTTLGHGRRIGIWFQGCSIGCPHCISQDTWARTGTNLTTVARVLAICKEFSAEDIDGVTISGGEPFEQAEALLALVAEFRLWRNEPGFDVLAYSGLPLAKLKRDFAPILAQLDAVISEPFVAAKAPGKSWAGSSNQVLTACSELGRARYGAAQAAAGPQVQISVDPDAVWFIGIPRPGDMERIEKAVIGRGLRLGDVSWRA
jgi:anaerobic ribonucleoside-triphosphate reductase activating protein